MHADIPQNLAEKKIPQVGDKVFVWILGELKEITVEEIFYMKTDLYVKCTGWASKDFFYTRAEVFQDAFVRLCKMAKEIDRQKRAKKSWEHLFESWIWLADCIENNFTEKNKHGNIQ